MSVKSVSKNNFEALKQDNKIVLLDFYADWCGPCRMVAPTVDAIAEERSDISVGKVNVDKEGELAALFGVYSIPTLVVLKDGKEAIRAVGVRSRAEILDMLARAGA